MSGSAACSIPHARKLAGHSDADVALHALTDAILGALADGDIGVHFPPSDEQWRGASSDRFLAFAVERVTRARRHDRPSRRRDRVRGAEGQSAPRRDARAHRRDRRRCRSTASASRRPPTRSSASSARRRHRRLRDRDDPPALERSHDRRRDARAARARARCLPRAQMDGRDGGILHRRAGRGRAHRNRRLVRRGRPRLRHLFQRRQDGACSACRRQRLRRMAR